MSNALRNVLLMDYYRGITDTHTTTLKVVKNYKEGKLTKEDYEHILDTIESGLRKKTA